MASPTFKFRPATLSNGDDRWFVEAWDSTFPFLSSVGSNSQWTELPSSQPARVEKVRGMVSDSDATCAKEADGFTVTGAPPEGWAKAFVAEVEIERRKIPDALNEKYSLDGGEPEDLVTVPVGAMVLHGKSADYVRSVIPEQDEVEPFLYLLFLVADHRAGVYAKGSGAALIALAKEEVKKMGLRRLCGDCWRGNDGKLVAYYDKQGLKSIGSFDVPKPGEGEWPGAVFEWKDSL
ncbi:hypothetical protein H072_7614 [Dactylellina haptotyla CBS 200.50]|uniref:N-acetyltransferase domain-containing protein n=1 Tax=Dactylellina haptotyla (strain CBS 200.50) TaxID=1284197 RepID=S8A6Y5_DACHA|nr:hypothetical protein H072_7614 [Dactylellina haptotyla CBS 200.50]